VGAWCNGNTLVFKTENRGSIPLALVSVLFFTKRLLMGQLEAYGINEMYLTGMTTGLFSNYFAEEQESNTFESFKVYFYSAVFVVTSHKLKNIAKKPLTIVTVDGAAYRSWSYFGFGRTFFAMTKLVDNFPM
jgi:hypothetical protein